LGRLTLNILLSFAQFEREIISERTRDKLSAARRKGKWIGGWQVLGYDIDAKANRLVVNPKEAGQVREIFEMAARAESLEAAVRQVHASGLKTKSWSTKKGKRHPARAFNRTMLRRLLSNLLYKGCVGHKGTIYPGEQERIIDPPLWDQVNAKLSARGQQQQGRIHRKQKPPLANLLFCSACDSPMTATFTTRQGHRHRYYGCCAARRREGSRCDQGFVAAADLEPSILHHLQPVLGAGLNWPTVIEAVKRIEYHWQTNGVSIYFKEGTRLDYEMALTPRGGGAQGTEPKANEGRVPRISRLMALAIKFERLISDGSIRTYRVLAEAGRITRARLSQIIRLTELAPCIQEELLFLPKTVHGSDPITEKALRAVTGSPDWEVQKQRFASLKATGSQLAKKSLGSRQNGLAFPGHRSD
jgi:hypothetical protein